MSPRRWSSSASVLPRKNVCPPHRELIKVAANCSHEGKLLQAHQLAHELLTNEINMTNMSNTCNALQGLQLPGCLVSRAGAQQFREQFEQAMAQNETLLALDDAEANSKDATPTEVSDLADQVSSVCACVYASV